MSRRTSPPFRADHVGSLLRPPRLHQAREDFAAGRISPADLRAVEDEEITRAVRMQEEVGLQSATDGEFRRATWHMDFINQIGGIGQAAGHIKVRFRNASGDQHPMHLHRHSFEVTKIDDKPTSGLMKDVVNVMPLQTLAVDFIADNPGDSLMHCHQQLHMDYGFMQIVKYKA